MTLIKDDKGQAVDVNIEWPDNIIDEYVTKDYLGLIYV